MDVYLDQNQWIPLARAFHGQDSDPARKRVCQLASEAAVSGSARFPVSRLHLMEATKTPDDGQRTRLIEAFIHFGRGWVMRPVELLNAEELISWSRGEAALADSAVDRGLLAAFSAHETAALRLGVPAREVEEVNRLGDSAGAWHDALTSPEFRAQVDQIHAAASAYAARVDEVRGKWSELPRNKRKQVFAEGLVRDTIELFEPPSPELKPAIDRLVTLAPEALLDAISKIPTLDVLFALSEGQTRDLSRPTDPNDLWDLGFLAAAVPYCQVVVTEKYWTHLAKATKLDTKYDCQIMARLEDLLPVLDEVVQGPGSGSGGKRLEDEGGVS